MQKRHFFVWCFNEACLLAVLSKIMGICLLIVDDEKIELKFKFFVLKLSH